VARESSRWQTVKVSWKAIAFRMERHARLLNSITEKIFTPFNSA